MKIATFNVNSLRARIDNVVAWIDRAEPDVLLLQELKCETAAFPSEPFEARGYASAVVGQKSWNGVAILSRRGIDGPLIERLPGEPEDEQARYVEATVAGVRVAAIYLPNGNPVGTGKYPYKLRWMARLAAHARDLLARGGPVALGGDWNVIPAADDAADPAAWTEDALFRLETRRAFREILHLGWTDALRAVDPRPHQFTFWDYQARAWERDDGIRIDHVLLSPAAADRLEGAWVDRWPRGQEKASDHTPLVVELADD